MYYKLDSFFTDVKIGQDPSLYDKSMPDFVNQYVEQNLQFYFSTPIGDCAFMPDFGCPRDINDTSPWENKVKKNLTKYQQLLFPILRNIKISVNLLHTQEEVTLNIAAILIATNEPFKETYIFSIKHPHNQ